MKIVFLIPSIRSGGAERQFIVLAKSLIEFGYTISFITYKDKNRFYELNNIEHVHIPKIRKIDLRFLKSLVDYIKQSKIDILFSCYEGRFEGPLLWARLAKLFYPKVKVISGYRNSKYSKILMIIEKMTNRLVSYYVSNNPAVISFLVLKLKIERNRVVYIRNIADRDNFYTFKQNKITKLRSTYFPRIENKFICGLLGSYSHQKNYRLIVEAVEHLQKKNEIDDIYFSIYGDKECVNSKFEKLKAQIKKNGLDSKISLNTTIKKVNELMNSIDVLIMTSLWEGMPNVVMEAMMCKKPVIISEAANTAGLIIEGINGFVFETNNHIQLANCILRIKNNPIEITESYLDDFYKKHDKKSVVNDYINCFESI